MTHQEMIDHNKRVIENITNRREKANLELDNFFASKVNFIHQDDTHSKEPHLYQGKSCLSDTPIVESENGCGASSNTETEIERCRQRLLLREYKKVEEVVLALKEKHKIHPQTREARLLKRLPHVVENFLNTLVVLQYLPKER